MSQATSPESSTGSMWIGWAKLSSRSAKPEPGHIPISRGEPMDDGRTQPLDDPEFLRRGAGGYDPHETFRARYRRTAGAARQGPRANPYEYVLHALAACLTTSLVYHAAARGIHLESVESTWKEISMYEDFSGCRTRSGEATRKSVSTLRSSRTRLQNS